MPVRPDNRDRAILPSCRMPRRPHRPAFRRAMNSGRHHRPASIAYDLPTPVMRQTETPVDRSPATVTAGALPDDARPAQACRVPVQDRMRPMRQPVMRRPVPVPVCTQSHRYHCVRRHSCAVLAPARESRAVYGRVTPVPAPRHRTLHASRLANAMHARATRVACRTTQGRFRRRRIRRREQSWETRGMEDERKHHCKRSGFSSILQSHGE